MADRCWAEEELTAAAKPALKLLAPGDPGLDEVRDATVRLLEDVFADVQVMPPRYAQRLKKRMDTGPPAVLSMEIFKTWSFRA